MVSRSRSGATGWTLVELTIVISLMTILASMAMVGYRNALTRSREAVLKEDLFRIRDGIDQYNVDKGEYPASLDDLVTAGYLRAVPQDPFTSTADSWITEAAEFDPANPFSQGVYNVRSGSEGTAMDGSSYREW